MTALLEAQTAGEKRNTVFSKMKGGVLVSHPFGNANVRQAALAFSEAGCLSGFRTCINWPEKSRLASLIPASIGSQFARRTFPPAVSAVTKSRPFREMGRLAAMRFGQQRLIRHEAGAFSTDAVARDLDYAVARELRNAGELPSAIYAYEDGALASFQAARERGVRRFYDLPIGYWQEARAIQAEEALRQPEWVPTLTAMSDSPEKLRRKDAELDLAEAIFVASRYTASTLPKRPASAAEIFVIPYGCSPPETEPTPPHTGPLRVLFVGSLGQRKGTSYLLSAVEQLGKHATLTLIGSRPENACTPLDRALQQHRWIPSLPHGEILREMRQHDVLVFPSLFEGFGLVILEALSQGIPVITTSHTGGPDVLSDGEDGYLVPIRDVPSITEKLIFLQNSAHLQDMKAAALKKAGARSWHGYRSELANQVTRLLV